MGPDGALSDSSVSRARPRLDLTVTDVKQFAYCPRIPYYRYVLPVRSKGTYPMERGKAVQAAVEALEKRRGFRRYNVAQGTRRFGLSLHSAGLGLHGRLDLMIETPEACFPVDFKNTEGPVRMNHRVQLAAYALLIEDVLAVEAPAGFIYRVPTRDVFEVTITERDRAGARGMLAELRERVDHEAIPDPTPVRNRCTACEFRNYCGDIW